MELYVLKLEYSHGVPDWRIYQTEGRASAALHLAMHNGRNAVGGTLYSLNTEDLQETEVRGKVGPVIEQDPLF